MRTDSSIRIALALVLPVAFAAAAQAQEPEPAEAERCDCWRVEPSRDHAFSFFMPYLGGTAQLGVWLDSGAADGDIGARIREVREDGPAAAAGLRAGDVITAIDGRSIARRDADDARPDQQLARRLRGIEPGDTVRIDYRRDGEALAVNVITTERTPPYHGRRIEVPSFDMPSVDIDVPDVSRAEWVDGVLRIGRSAGLELADMNEALGQYFGVDHGVLVIDVRSGSSLGLEAGDVVLRIGDRDVRDARHARSIIASYRDDESVQIEIMRDRQRQTITGQAR